MAYLLDADVLIQAKNMHYGLDFCPAFWDWLVEQNSGGRVFSVRSVQEELQDGIDELATWATARGPGFFLVPDDPMAQALPMVSAWVEGNHYRRAAITAFLGSADYYLVAHALGHGHTVVTHEKARNRPTEVKIPEVCAGVGVECVTPFEMLRAAGARFVLDGH